jgi:carbon storage regulator
VGESIQIGPDIEVVVLKFRGKQVRLGISAPQAVAVHRTEVLNTLRLERVRSMLHDKMSLAEIEGVLDREDEEERRDA